MNSKLSAALALMVTIFAISGTALPVKRQTSLDECAVASAINVIEGVSGKKLLRLFSNASANTNRLDLSTVGQQQCLKTGCGGLWGQKYWTPRPLRPACDALMIRGWKEKTNGLAVWCRGKNAALQVESKSIDFHSSHVVQSHNLARCRCPLVLHSRPLRIVQFLSLIHI